MVYPGFKPGFKAEPFNKPAGSFAKEIHAYHEENGINNAGYNDPFPQFMFFYKLVGLDIGMNGYYNFF